MSKFSKTPVFLITVILLCVLVNTAFSQESNRRQKVAPAYEKLQSLANKNDRKVRVIATLKNSHNLRSSSPNLNKARNNLVSSMKRKSLSPSKQYNNLPFVVYEVSANELDALIDSDLVETVVEDRINKHHLSNSRRYIGADVAEMAGYVGSGAVVAVLDTGFQAESVFFGNRVVEEACFSSSGFGRQSLCPNGDETGPGTATGSCNAEDCYHGTHVASIAAGQHSTYSGVATQADIIMVQVFTRGTSPLICGTGISSCLVAYDSDILAGMAFVESLAATYNIAAVNLSLGGGQHFSECVSSSFNLFKNQVNALKALGIATIASSGNNGYTNAMVSPACIPEVISVGSVKDTGNTVSSFSNSTAFLDFMAPGEPIIGAVPTWVFSNGRGQLSGTSMAAPHVAGAYTLLKSINSSLTVDEITNLLKQQSVSFTDNRNGLSFPSLRLNTDNDADSLIFLEEVELGTDPEDSAPTLTINSPLSNTNQLQSLQVGLMAIAIDSEDGDLSSSIQWSSNLDGNLGAGSSLDISLNPGVHTILATVTDSAGASPVFVSSVDVEILPDNDADGMDDDWEALYAVFLPNEDADSDGLINLDEYNLGSNPLDKAPVVSISSPLNDSYYHVSDQIDLIGSAIDTEDGDLSIQISWSSSLDGDLGIASSLQLPLSEGVHTITAVVIDSAGGLPITLPNIIVNIVDPLAGDINGDGSIDITDLILMKQFLIQLNNLSEVQQISADLFPSQRDRKITVSDLLTLEKLVLEE